MFGFSDVLRRKKLLLLMCGLFPLSVVADTNIAQSGDNPIVVDQSAETDNIVYLMAAGSEHNSGLSVRKAYPKHYYVTNFDDNTNDYMQWTVNVPTAALYSVRALLNTTANVPLRFSVEGTFISLNATTKDIGWDRFEMGNIYLPAGTHTLKLIRNADIEGNIEFKSLELIRASDLAAYETRVANYKKDMTWLSDSTFGLMFQYGAWGYPETGDRKSLDDGAADFDVDKFVNMVKETGAGYVIWSMTWWQYWVQAPIDAIDNIMGDSSLTAQRDLIGEVAQGLQDNGIRFMIYYHQGLQQEPSWAAKQNFPGQFDDTGTGDRTTFFNNWKAVVADVGARYGENLDGWFFDDGAAYYPAPFESMAEAARTGNPNRLISYNNINAVRYTDFQDMTFGESEHGDVKYGSAEEGGDGIYTDGPLKGLLQHSMFKMENGWGINDRDQEINTSISTSYAVAIAQEADARNIPLSFNMKMYEDGTVSQDSLDVLYAVRDRPESSINNIINDTDDEIVYVGTWLYSSGRSADDYRQDLHYTKNDGDYFEFTFEGEAIQYLAPMYLNYGEADVYLDGEFQETVSAYSDIYLSQQTLFSASDLIPGTHTLKVVKKNGAYMQLDGLIVDGELLVGQSAYVLTTIPGIIEAENYDEGGPDVAYLDTTLGNSGDVYRLDGVDIQVSEDVGGGYNVGWTADGEWLEYTIYDVIAGTYKIDLRIGVNTDVTDKSIVVILDGKPLGTVDLVHTGGWQNWQTVSLENVDIEAGSDQILRLEFVGGGVNLNSIEFIAEATESANAALGKEATQSSTGYDSPASLAVDGNTNGIWVNGSVTHTLTNEQAWWQVDLGSLTDIDTVNVWGRTDSCCASRLTNFYVFVSDEPFISNDLDETLGQDDVSAYLTTATAGSPTIIDVDRSGRYVRVQLVGTEALSLAEVEVMKQ
ncbi:DUF5010 C-terminal domain-containing protein [Aliiglaciecola sp. 3_MG-2023]|uniref:carbohydrate-binding domain-containing protein n=1 Tax=Aliiglaciecola sp. 3_MG-2023 TaxID=3062644 RepID=UPI0026E3222C|nr:carbohydrate-binding domain-containing protein [Aliiglaciecola sp. 3_MG-2023]MDO6693130.1 DUF5010 C-terminal domain-containing protein [Aliiglaciecola sp. 3_MG-2023]